MIPNPATPAGLGAFPKPTLTTSATAKPTPQARNAGVRQKCAVLRLAALCGVAGFLFLQTATAPAAPVTAPRPAEPIVEVLVDPPKITLDHPAARFRVLVTGKTASGQLLDLTHTAQLRSLDAALFQLNPQGELQARRDGRGLLEVRAAGQTVHAPVEIIPADAPPAYSFEKDITPLLSRLGCNGSSCHAKAEGQAGFKLSVFGSDPAADYRAITKEGRGRRISTAAPELSLVLQKPGGALAHRGGVRFSPDSPELETFRNWIAAGAPFGTTNDARVTALHLTPAERVLRPGATQQLRVVATYSDGRRLDVTRLAQFQSNQEILARVSDDGLVTASTLPGQAAVMARFMGEVAVFLALIPREGAVAAQAPPPQLNFIDTFVDARLRKLNLRASDLCSDAEFLRRASLDITGTLPTPAEARQFLADRRPDRRARLVDALLDRPAYADLWALKWSDVLRVDRQKLTHKEAYSYYHWIRRLLAANRPFDQLARELLTSEGPLDETGSGYFYKVAAKPGEMANMFSQVFLGVRIACAECHHHPHDRWSQNDYYGMTAFFQQVAFRKGGAGEVLLAEGNPVTRNPRTGDLVPPQPLGAEPLASLEGDRRPALAEWLASPNNPWFARNLVNRLVAHFFGRGLIEPVDDARLTNPASNPELLDALAKHALDQRFDLKAIIRTLTASRTYQLSASPNDTNESDEQNYSRALFRRLPAEVLFDAVCQVTGVPEKFDGVPAGYRATQVWDSDVKHYFLKIFGRPLRTSPCECERQSDASVAQVLHLLNSPEIHDKLAHAAGAVSRLVKSSADDTQLADELYLACFSRLPTAAERKAAVQHLQTSAGQRRESAEDLAWSLLNSLEFIFNH